MKNFKSFTFTRHCEECACARRGNPHKNATNPTGLPRSRWSLAMTSAVKRVSYGSVGSRSAFTMAEILLSLTIIGVVAAITLPSLTGNINERVWNTQRKALYARFSQAIALMPQLNGYGTLVEATDTISAQDTAAETFITEGLSKVLKINNICDNTHLTDCGIPSSYTNMLGYQKTMATSLIALNYNIFRQQTYSNVSFSVKNTKAVAFETQNGESLIAYYNPNCRSEFTYDYRNSETGATRGFPAVNMCVSFIYDLNGTKGPNTVGQDIGFITVFNAINPTVVAPMPLKSNAAGGGQPVWANALTVCNTEDPESRLPNIDELSAMLVNRELTGLNASMNYWSGTVLSSGVINGTKYKIVAGITGDMRDTLSTYGTYRLVRCIKR